MSTRVSCFQFPVKRCFGSIDDLGWTLNRERKTGNSKRSGREPFLAFGLQAIYHYLFGLEGTHGESGSPQLYGRLVKSY
jgi:hypothetical protein